MAVDQAGTKLITADSIDATLCTIEGVSHDYRHREHTTCWNMTETSWTCVWCSVVACGDINEPDPCWQPYHHLGPHTSRAGVVWPLGGSRPR